MIIKPVYDAGLDYWYVRNGKPNHPSRYGLTTPQVMLLKKHKMWKKFLREWEALRSLHYVNKLDRCCVCNERSTNGIIVLSNRICKRCCSEIKYQLKHGGL